MTIETVLVSGQLRYPDGTLAANTPITFTLSGAAVAGLALLLPKVVNGVSDAAGLIAMQVAPSPAGTYYSVRASRNGALLFAAQAVVPANACQLTQIMQALPVPSIPAAQQALIDLQAAQAEIEADRQSAAASAVSAGQNAIQVSDDVVQTGADRIATGQDRAAIEDATTQTGDDRTQTGADRIATGQDRAVTVAAAAQTALDRIATGQDATTATDNAAAAIAAKGLALDAQQTALEHAQAADVSRQGAEDAQAVAGDSASIASAGAAAVQLLSDLHYGASATDPLTRPSGAARQTGDEYFSTSANLLKRWNGATWQASDINTANLAASGGAALVGTISARPGASGRTVQDELRERDSILQYVLPADGGDAGKSLKRAIDAGCSVIEFPNTMSYSFLSAQIIPIAKGVTLKFNGSTLNFNGGYVRLESPTVATGRTLASDAARYATSLILSSAASIQAGDLLYLNTTIAVELAWSYTKKDLIRVKSVTGNTVELDEPLNFSYTTLDAGLDVSAIRPYAVTLDSPEMNLVTAAGQAMIEIHGALYPRIISPVARGAVVFDPVTDVTRRAIHLHKCWNPHAENVVFERLSYPVLITGGTRNTTVLGVNVKQCRHAIEMADWAKGLKVSKLTGSDSYQTVSAHPAFDVHFDGVNVERDSGMTNLRCIRSSLANAKIHTLAGDADSGPYFQNLALTAAHTYLNTDSDLSFDAVEIVSPNRTAATLGAGYARTVRVSRSTASGFDASIAAGVGVIEWGMGNKIAGRAGPVKGFASGTVRNRFQAAGNPRIDAYLDAGVYHVNPRLQMVDQSQNGLKVYGRVVANLTADAVIPLRIHTNCLGHLDNPAQILGVLKLNAVLIHANLGSFSRQERHFNFYQKTSATSACIFPYVPVHTSGLSGQANESMAITVGNMQHAGFTQQGASGDFWVQVDVTLASGGRSSPVISLSYELELFY